MLVHFVQLDVLLPRLVEHPLDVCLSFNPLLQLLLVLDMQLAVNLQSFLAVPFVVQSLEVTPAHAGIFEPRSGLAPLRRTQAATGRHGAVRDVDASDWARLRQVLVESCRKLELGLQTLSSEKVVFEH